MMTEQQRAELREVIDEAFQRWWFPVWRQANEEGAQILAEDMAVMGEREACALIAEKMGQQAVADAIRGQ
jgi:hypothetical protein